MYLQYVSHTESPKLMHLWSAISGASACMGRHVSLPFGIGNIHPNMFVLLVGPPGTRKSQAIKYSSSIIKDVTGVRFAPDDTGGQRQGLITAMEGDTQLDSQEQEMAILDNAIAINSLTDLGNLQVSTTNATDSAHIFACASEFGTFMGEGNVNMTRFLNKVWEGEDYYYKLKSEQKVLKEPLMTIVGGTTTSDIARILPAESIGQGFMSRWILAFAPQKAKKVARPFLDPELRDKLGEVFAWLHYEMRGEMQESVEAHNLLNDIYENENIDLQDSRFLYYAERRHTHLQKLAMVLAAVRKSYTIEVGDVQEAVSILSATEEFMPEALGEFGLSPVGAAKQKMVEFLQHTNEPVTSSILWSVMQRDMKISDYRAAIADLINSDKIEELMTNNGQAFIYKGELHEALSLLEEGLL
jgi:hypothetical protein